MYYLRLVEEDLIVHNCKGEPVHLGPSDRAVYKHNRLGRFYREDFDGIGSRHGTYRDGSHLYTSRSMNRILDLRRDTFNYCNEIFDVYDENGKVELTKEQYESYRSNA